jgi:hypothetical protein
MIVVRLIGGLGNQMFQYAAGKALALHHNTHLLIDKIALEQDAKGAFTKRNYALGCFNIDASFATNEQIAFFEEESAGKLKRAFNRMFPAAKKKVVYYESGHRFHENFFTLPQDTYLIGFWQTEKYFGKFQEQIRNDFTLRHPVPEEVEDLLSEIRDTNSTSLHVRRGDYVSLQSAADFHGTPELDYYTKAVEHIIGEKGKTSVYVFSDDLIWCRKHLSFDLPVTFVQQSHGAEWDMYLMSQCRNNIIANSSFSWWGAWLNPHPEKIVTVPEYWFKNTRSDSMDIVARGWKIIK